MKLKAVPVTSLEDATIDFEQLQVNGIFNDTTLGGALTGKLPNPSLSTAAIQSFLQLAPAQSLKLQFNRGSVSAAIGVNAFNVTLNAPWPANHFVFLCGAVPNTAATATDFLMQSGVISGSLTQGFIRISSSAAQTWNVNWISLGN